MFLPWGVSRRFKCIYWRLPHCHVVTHTLYPLFPLFTSQVSEKYKFHDKKSLPPHIFAVADRAYQSMVGRLGTGPMNQCIVIRYEVHYSSFDGALLDGCLLIYEI